MEKSEKLTPIQDDWLTGIEAPITEHASGLLSVRMLENENEDLDRMWREAADRADRYVACLAEGIEAARITCEYLDTPTGIEKTGWVLLDWQHKAADLLSEEESEEDVKKRFKWLSQP